jgi:UPF0042 nucleotide-binding protein
MSNPTSKLLLQKIYDIFDTMLPLYLSEKRNSINISIGCTGGKHRSVAIAEELKGMMAHNEHFDINIYHRDINR